MSGITTHVLDTAAGGPAAGIPITLEKQAADAWRQVGQGITNEDGRVPGLLVEALEAATYRITFETQQYLASRHGGGFYPFVSIVFSIRAATEHYHVPLLLSPYGYQTYRGS